MGEKFVVTKLNLGVENEVRLNEECGVFGLYLHPSLANNNIVNMAIVAAAENQHRGESSVGLCLSDGYSQWPPLKTMGLYSELLRQYNEQKNGHGGLYGHIAITHNRYSTTGDTVIENAGPFQKNDRELGSICVAHNGNLTNTAKLQAELMAQGVEFTSTTDSEIISALIVQSPGENWSQKITHAVQRLEGAFSLVISTKDKLFAVKDSHGFRPLSIAKFEIEGLDSYAISSETPALSKFSPKIIRDLEPGEIIEISTKGYKSTKFTSDSNEAICGLEFAYLYRPDSYIEGIQLAQIRRDLGEVLAENYPVPDDVDLVTYVPESAKESAGGFADGLNKYHSRFVPVVNTMMKNRYGSVENGATRGFIQAKAQDRKKVANEKYYPFDTLIDKKIVLVDDSIIEGTTMIGVLKMLKYRLGILKDRGVAQVHLRIIFPQVKFPCYFGVDIGEDRELVAKLMNGDNQAIAKYLGADSLAYLTDDEFNQSINRSLGREVGLCRGCTQAYYPILPTVNVG